MKIPYTQIKHIKLHELATDVKFKNRYNEFKQQVPVHEWKKLQRFVSEINGLTEEESAVSDDQIEQLILQAAKELKGRVKRNPEEINVDALQSGEEGAIKTENQEVIKESLSLALFLGAPTILKLIGKLIDWVYRKFILSKEEKRQWQEAGADLAYAKEMGKLPNGKKVSDDEIHHMEEKMYKSKIGKKLYDVSHSLHDAYIFPLRSVIAGLMWVMDDKISTSQAWKNAKRAADLIYAVIMIGIAGYGALHSLQSIPSVAAAISTVGGYSALATSGIDLSKGADMVLKLIRGSLGHVHI